MSFASTLGKYKIDGASRKNKSWPGGHKAATWFFDVAKVKTALDPTNMSSMSVTSTPTTTAIPTVQAVTPVINLIDDDESEPEPKKMKVEDKYKYCMYCGAQLNEIANFCTKCGKKQ